MAIRSPSYPSVSLPVAIEKAQQIHESFGDSEMNLEDSLHRCGYKSGSSSGRQLVAAMQSFGLLEDSGRGSTRRFKISSAAMESLYSDEIHTGKKSRAIRDFSLRPVIYQVLWERWGFRIPGDAELKDFLVTDLGFNVNVLSRFLQDYVASIQYARRYGLKDPLNENSEDDTDLEFSDDDPVVQLFSSWSQTKADEDTDLDLDDHSVPLTQSASSADRDADVVLVEPDLAVWAGASDSVDIVFESNDQDSMHFPDSACRVGDASAMALSVANSGFVQYQVTADCSITLVADAPVNRQAVESLISQLQEDMRSGLFDFSDKD